MAVKVQLIADRVVISTNGRDSQWMELTIREARIMLKRLTKILNS